jgi:hypothetical protein
MVIVDTNRQALVKTEPVFLLTLPDEAEFTNALKLHLFRKYVSTESAAKNPLTVRNRGVPNAASCMPKSFPPSVGAKWARRELGSLFGRIGAERMPEEPNHTGSAKVLQ